MKNKFRAWNIFLGVLIIQTGCQTGCGGKPGSPVASPSPVLSNESVPKVQVPEESVNENTHNESTHDESTHDESTHNANAYNANALNEIINSAHHAAEMLGLRVIPGDERAEDPEMPDPQVELARLSELDDSTVDGNEILLHTKFFLPDPLSPNAQHRRKLFLVWPENSLESPVTSAVYSHRILNSQNQRHGNLNPFRAWHDTDNHRWFIPMTEIFRNREDYTVADIRLEDVQEVTLELTLESGALRIIRIRFQAVGPFPEVQRESLTLESPRRAATLIHRTSDGGWRVHKDSFRNPFRREFFLWLRGGSTGQDLELTSYLKHCQYSSTRNSEPVAQWIVEQSTAKLKVNSLRVRHQNGDVERVALSPQRWSRVTLRPSETLTVEWRANPVARSRECQLPPRQTIQLTWQTRRSENVSSEYRGIPLHFQFEAPRFHSRVAQIDWKFEGGIISGAWMREVRLTHPFTIDQQAVGEEPSSVYVGLVRDRVQTRIVSGSDLSSGVHSNYACQGIFR